MTLPKRNRTPRWERSKQRRPIKLTARDLEIFEIVHRHRFIEPPHVYVLLREKYPNTSLRYIARRMTHLCEGHFLRLVDADDVAYELAAAAGRALGVPAPDETTRRYVEHQLGVVDVMVALQLACPGAGVTLEWDGHQARERFAITSPDRSRQIPDAYFRLDVPGYKPFHHYLEYDRGSRPLPSMAYRFEGYLRWWKYVAPRGEPIRVLTIAPTPGRITSLRKVAAPIGRGGRYRRSWPGFLFTDLQAFDLEHPERILEEIFLPADSDQPVSLVSPAVLDSLKKSGEQSGTG